MMKQSCSWFWSNPEKWQYALSHSVQWDLTWSVIAWRMYMRYFANPVKQQPDGVLPVTVVQMLKANSLLSLRRSHQSSRVSDAGIIIIWVKVFCLNSISWLSADERCWHWSVKTVFCFHQFPLLSKCCSVCQWDSRSTVHSFCWGECWFSECCCLSSLWQ